MMGCSIKKFKIDIFVLQVEFYVRPCTRENLITLNIVMKLAYQNLSTIEIYRKVQFEDLHCLFPLPS